MPQNNASAVNEAEKIDESEAVKGRVTRVQGSVIDIEFPIGHMPDIYNELTVEIPAVGTVEGENSATITLEVEQHLGDSIVRAVALKPTDGLVRGAVVTETGGPIEVPVGNITLGHVLMYRGISLTVRKATRLL